MIFYFSKTVILTALLCFIIFYKYFFRKKVLMNMLLDCMAGTIVLFISTDYLKSQIPFADGHGSVIIYLYNFIFYAVLYLVSTSLLYWKKPGLYGILVPAGLFSLYTVYVFFFFELAEIYEKCVLFPVFVSFFPIYIYNYFQAVPVTVVKNGK